MAKTLEQSRVRTRNIPSTWDELVTAFLSLRPITSNSAHEKAVIILEKLAVLPNMNKAQSDYFEVLSDLVVKYEDKHWNIDTSDISVVDTLKSFMEDHKMTGADLGRLIGGDRTIASKVLNGKRKLTTEQVKILSKHFKVSADLFIG